MPIQPTILEEGFFLFLFVYYLLIFVCCFQSHSEVRLALNLAVVQLEQPP